MKNIKFFTLSIIFFLTFNISQILSQKCAGCQSGNGNGGGTPVSCTYVISGSFIGEGVETITIAVSTGANIVTSAATQGSFSQPITLPGSSIPVTAIISGTATDPNNGINVFVNGALVRQPTETKIVTFNRQNCTVSF